MSHFAPSFKHLSPAHFELQSAGGKPHPQLRTALQAAEKHFDQHLSSDTIKQGSLAVPADHTINWEKLGIVSDISAGTFKAPRGRHAIRKTVQEFINNETLTQAVTVSALALDWVHPGCTYYARHLHPSQSGLTTGKLEDWKRVRMIWRYPPPKKGELHPEHIKITDGSLAAAWLVDEEGPELARMLKLHCAKSLDFLDGNHHAFDKGLFRRIFFGVMHRFKSYGVGIAEGLADPRFNGKIAANLIITGLTISAGLYMLFYGIDYVITMKDMPKKPGAKNALHHGHNDKNSGNVSTAAVVAGAAPGLPTSGIATAGIGMAAAGA